MRRSWAERICYANVEFRKGRIQDLALDLELLDRQLKTNEKGLLPEPQL
jgi:hypothetical protein